MNEPETPREISLRPYIVINENTQVGEEGVPFEFSDCPKRHLADNMLAFFEGEEIEISLSVESKEMESNTHLVSSNNTVGLNFNSEGTIKGCIRSKKEITLHCFIIYFIDMAPAPVILREKCVFNYPEQGMKIGFELADLLDEALAWSTLDERHAQLKHPNGNVDNIRGSTANYVWRGQNLHMNIPVGSTYQFRIKYSTEEDGWIDWSNWLPIVPKRKMSL